MTMDKSHTKRVLFICKLRPARYGASYGLLNSCRFLCNALNSMGVDADLVEVIDNNHIDRVVHKYKPTHVFIEALWVVPEKFDILIPLHPTVQWYVRLHSNIPFLANEGMAIEWLQRYNILQKRCDHFKIAANSEEMVFELKSGINADVVYSPNIYQPHKTDEMSHWGIPKDKDPNIFDVASFGAIRPLKNQLMQAVAAIAFAEKLNKPLRFHINYSRIENNGENVHKNLQALFKNTNNELVEHDWMPHEDFMKLILSMDLGLQVSFTETFNIVCSDFVHLNIPIVGSPEIKWLNPLYQANPTDLKSIIRHMWIAWNGKKIDLQLVNKHSLEKYNHAAKKEWKHILDI